MSCLSYNYIASFNSLRKKMLYLKSKSFWPDYKNTTISYMGKEVGYLWYSWSSMGKSYSVRCQLFELTPHFHTIKSKVKRIICNSDYTIFISVLELCDLLQEIGLSDVVEDVKFKCKSFLFITRHSYSFGKIIPHYLHSLSGYIPSESRNLTSLVEDLSNKVVPLSCIKRYLKYYS